MHPSCVFLKVTMPETVEDTKKAVRAAVIEALVAGETIATAAEMAKVSPRTIYDWRQDPEFKKQLAARQKEVIEEIKGRLHPLVDMAYSSLRDCLQGNVGETAKWKATELVLRTFGLVGEKAEAQGDVDDKVELIPIGLNANDEVIELETDETPSNPTAS
jgi:transposase